MQEATTGQRHLLPVKRPLPAEARGISPTDVAQFIRLDQCARYLRLRLHERAVGRRFMSAYGVAPQSIPPILTRSGARFEDRIEADVARRYTTANCATEAGQGGDRGDDNARVVACARDLAPGDVLVLFQARLEVEIEGWRLRGDVDILRLERDAAGELRVLIADMKSSTTAKVEHRLQVAFYHEMLAALLAREGIACGGIELAILYRGPAGGGLASPEELDRRAAQCDAAERLLGTREGLLEAVEDPDAYRGAVRDLVTAPDSTAVRVSQAPFEQIPYHLTYKCDGCLYNEFCMKWSAAHDDLSLLPHLTVQEKSALRHAGVTTMRQLATLKEPAQGGAPDPPDPPEPAAGSRQSAAELPELQQPADIRLSSATSLVPAPGREALVRRLAATPPVGARLDELVHRARRYRKWRKDPITALSYIPSKGYGSLPYADAEHNPNLVRVYVDAQHDYLHDRIYMLGALVSACAGGEPRPERRRGVVHLTEGPPDTEERERELFLRWTVETIRAIVELAAPDGEGRRRAPIHLIFVDNLARRLLLEGLGRHTSAVLGATPLYDFVTQLAAFDSPVATFLDQEIRELKNYPMVCQSLQAVAAYLKFDWNAPEPYREIFRTRLFDFWGKLDRNDAESPWYTNRARFNSQIPLEYAYAAWGDLQEPAPGQRDEFAGYRGVTPALLAGFHARRLEAMEHITSDFPGNRQTEKRVFELPSLDEFAEKAPALAQALAEFVTIERHVELSDWKAARLAPPERRVLAGETLLVRYEEADQEPEVAANNAENVERARLREQYRAAYLQAHPGAKRVVLTDEQRAASEWSHADVRFRLRLDCAGLDCDMDEALALSTLREGAHVVICPRTTVDSRLPADEQAEFTPTPRQMLYGMRGEIGAILVTRDESGRAVEGLVEVTMRAARGGAWSRGFVFAGIDQPFAPGRQYTLDPDPNNWYGYACAKVVEGLCAGGRNTLYDRLADPASAGTVWPPAAVEGQARFLAGLDALQRAGAMHPFEESKRAYIGAHGDAPTLLVQGPPGTGKSYATAFAVFSRLQGAMAAGVSCRAVVCCKTHAATDVLLENVVHVQQLLRELWQRHPAIMEAYFDIRLLDVPLYRLRPRGAVPDGVTALRRPEDRGPDEPRNADVVRAQPWCVTAATPGAINTMIKEFSQTLFGHELCDLLVLDEASQMNLPEAMMAALPLAPLGRLIVVGDHRQMPPIVKHNWGAEPRRTFQEYRSYESLFLTLLAQRPPLIQFSESFRLHADMAAFLREEVYRKDGIAYFSRRHDLLPPAAQPDPFVAAVLAREHALVVVVHDEAASQQRNAFEQALIAPVLQALAELPGHPLDPEHGLGVVVPHRAQRAALQDAVPCLTRKDPVTGAVTVSAVDTVERFQGDERTAILVSATESDREYLLVSSEFLLDPRRLTVALSRAKRKMILVASESVFSLFSADEETFEHAQLWKNLLRRTCTVKLWEGERDGHRVAVWGNVPAAAPS